MFTANTRNGFFWDTHCDRDWAGIASCSSVKKEACNLGVILKSEPCFDSQVTEVVQFYIVQLRDFYKISSFLSSADLEKVIHAFISFRLDYWCSLFRYRRVKHSKTTADTKHCFQAFHTLWKRSDHFTPILATLHWLPVNFTVDFKVLLLVFKSLNGQA